MCPQCFTSAWVRLKVKSLILFTIADCHIDTASHFCNVKTWCSWQKNIEFGNVSNIQYCASLIYSQHGGYRLFAHMFIPFGLYKLIFGAFLRQGVNRYSQVFLLTLTPKPFSFSTSPGLINYIDKTMSRAFKNQVCHVFVIVETEKLCQPIFK